MIPIFRLLGLSNCKGQDCGLSTDGKCGNAKIDGKNIYRRVFIKRIGWEYYQGKDEDGELWEVELDNCDEDDYEWWLEKCSNPEKVDLGGQNKDGTILKNN